MLFYLFLLLFSYNFHTIINFAAQAGSSNYVKSTSNLEFTERGDNELSTTQNVQLGFAQDAAPITASATNDELLQPAYKGSNLEVFEMNKTIERFYTLATINWSSSEGSGTQIGYYRFPDVLFSQNYINAIVPHFNLYRAGIRFSVRCAASRFNYGSLLVKFVPDIEHENYPLRGSSIYNSSGFPHMLVSASQSEAALIDVPFICPQRFIDTKTYQSGCLGAFAIVVLNPLVNISGEPDTIQLIIQAQFLEAEMCLPKDSTQSNHTIKKEGRKKSKSKTISSDQEESSISGGIVQIGAFVSAFADFMETHPEAIEAGAEALTMVGLNKPTTVEMPQIAQLDVVSDFNYGKGISMFKKFAMDPESSISTTATVGGVSVDEMQLSYVLGTPMMTSSNVITEGTVNVNVGSTSTEPIVAYETTFVDFVSRQFGFCSGSLKFKIYIFASQMHAVRLVFYLAKSTSNYEDCYHRFVDVQGDTSIELTLPYCETVFSRDLNTEATFYNIYCSVLSWSQPTPGANTPIYAVVYKAAGSDYRVGQLLDTQFIPLASDDFINVHPQSNPRKDFARPFDCFHPSMKTFDPMDLVYTESYTSIRDIIHRMYPYFKAEDGITMDTWQWPGSGVPTSVIGIELWSLLYRFYRGSQRVQYLRRRSSTGTYDVIQTRGLFLVRSDLGIYIPGFDMAFPDKPSLSAEIPWYSNQAFNYTSSQNVPDYSTVVTGDTGAFSYYCKSAGDDFTFHFLCPPPPGSITFNSATQGFQGLATWIAAYDT